MELTVENAFGPSLFDLSPDWVPWCDAEGRAAV